MSSGFESEPPVSAPSRYYQESESVVLVVLTKVIKPGLVGSIPVVTMIGEDQTDFPTRF